MSEGHDADLRVDNHRAWVELGDAALAEMNASEGDPIIVGLVLSMPKGEHGPKQRIQLVGIMGVKRTKKQNARVWLPEIVDVDRVESLTLRRRRAV